VNYIKNFLRRIWGWIMHNSFYQITGGGLRPDAPTYVEREADNLLWEFTQSERNNCGVCYILAPRQTGKTSLINKTVDKLRSQTTICVTISLQELGHFDSETLLYLNILLSIFKQVSDIGIIKSRSKPVNLVKKLNGLWSKDKSVQPTVKFREFLIAEILKKINTNLVIFIDEVQSLISWGLNNEFIGFLKSLTENNNEPSLKQLAFVLLGVAKPSDLVTNYTYAFNFGKHIEISYLTGDCEPLQVGLRTVTNNPQKVLNAILYWTGGQPFLTQILCNLVASNLQISEDTDIEDYIERIVDDKIISNWRRQDQQNHLNGIDKWFYTISPDQKLTKLAALRIYRSLLASGKGAIKFDEYNSLHWELLISGIVKKEDDYLEVANSIYEQIFNLNWVYERETFLQEDSMLQAPFSNIYNRDVFILIDQSGSMVRKDADTGEQTRYQYLEEVIEGHINSILSETTGQEKICDSVSVYFFSRNQVDDYPIKVSDAAQVQSLFLENKPKAKTFIGPTIDRCLDIWLAEGKPQNHGAFFIIYTDGLFDDEPRFVNCLEKACNNIEDAKAVKVIILGLGKDIDEMSFLNLYFNVIDRLPYNVFVFNLVNEVDDIIQELERQLVDNPSLAFPEWVKKKYPEFVKKVNAAR